MEKSELTMLLLATLAGLLGYLGKTAHAQILERLEKLDAGLERHIAEDEKTVKEVAVTQATIVERLDGLLRRLGDG